LKKVRFSGLFLKNKIVKSAKFTLKYEPSMRKGSILGIFAYPAKTAHSRFLDKYVYLETYMTNFGGIESYTVSQLPNVLYLG